MSARLDIAHLEAICAMFDLGTMRPAAEKLGLTQPALSYRLKEAERRLGVPLFVQSGRRITPTPSAERILLSARLILAELSEAENDLSDRAAGITSTVRLSLRAHTALHWLSPFVRHLRNVAPDLRIEFVPDAQTPPFSSLKKGGVDLALVAGGAGWPENMQRHLFVDPIVAIMPPGHPLCKKLFITSGDLLEFPFITYSIDSETGFEDEALFHPQGQFPSVTTLAGYSPACVQCVADGLGISIVPKWVAKPDLVAGRVISRPLTAESIKIDWQILWNATATDSAVAIMCADTLADWCVSEAGSQTINVAESRP